MIRKITIGAIGTAGAVLLAWISTVYTDSRADVNEVKIKANTSSISAVQKDIRDIHKVFYKKYRSN